MGNIWDSKRKNLTKPISNKIINYKVKIWSLKPGLKKKENSNRK